MREPLRFYQKQQKKASGKEESSHEHLLLDMEDSLVYFHMQPKSMSSMVRARQLKLLNIVEQLKTNLRETWWSHRGFKPSQSTIVDPILSQAQECYPVS
jgi:hypothetical protein